MQINISKIFCVVGLIFIVSGCGYGTLQEAVQSKWKSPVKVMNNDPKNQLVIYLDQTQYVFGVYEYKNDKYYYDNSQSSGWTSSSDIRIPLLVRAESKKDIGNFIWGAIYTDIPVGKIYIEYKSGETQETFAVNNTFILEMPDSFDNIEPIMFMGELNDVTVYDEDGTEIVSWSN